MNKKVKVIGLIILHTWHTCIKLKISIVIQGFYYGRRQVNSKKTVIHHIHLRDGVELLIDY